MQKAKEEQKALWRKVNDVYVTNLVAPHDESVKFIEKAWKKFAKKQPPLLRIVDFGASYFQRYPERIYQNLVTFYLCTGSLVNAEFFGLLTQQIKKYNLTCPNLT